MVGRYTIVCAATISFVVVGHANAQQACDTPQVISKVEDSVRAYYFSHPAALINFNVPYFRMKDVALTIVSIRTKGPSRTGLDCEIVLRLTPPPEFRSNTRDGIAKFGYVIIQKGGAFNIDLY